MKHLLFAIFLLSTISLTAQIEHQLKEITIEAESEKTAIKKQKEAGTSTIVVGSKELNNFGHHTAGDVIKRLPRVFVQGPPSFSRNIMMAGLDKQFQSILINGNRPAGGEDYRDLKLDRIPIDMIEDIEIIYNPPAYMGADATIGLVNIKLKDVPDNRFISTNLALDYTSTHSGVNPDFNLSYGDKFNKLSLIVSYSLNRFHRTNINYIEDTLYRGTEEEDLNVTIHGVTTTFAYSLDANKTLKLRSFLSHYAEDMDFVADIKRRTQGGLNLTNDTAFDTKLRVLHTHTLEYNIKNKNNEWRNSLNFAQHFDNKDRWRHQEKTSGLTITLEDESQRNSEILFNSDLTINKESHKIKIGVRLSGLWRDYDRVSYSKLYDHLFWDDVLDGSYNLTEYRGSAYLADDITINELWICPAVRLDYDAGNYTTAIDTGNLQYTSVNPSLHTKYSLSKNLFVKADVARQISRAPFNLQVPVDKIKHKKQLIERGNSELVPSLAWNVGFGVEKYIKEKSYFTVRAFYSVLRNVIEKKDVGIDDETGYHIFQSVNVDSGLVWGIDFDAHINILEITHNQLAVNGNFSWLSSEVRDPGTGELRRLNEQPKWITNGSLDYLNTNLNIQFSIGINYVGERQIAATISDGTDVDALIYNPYMQWDARLKYFFTTWGSVYFNAINIFDERVNLSQAAVSESEVVGRNYRIGVSLHF